MSADIPAMALLRGGLGSFGRAGALLFVGLMLLIYGVALWMQTPNPTLP